MKLSAKAVSSLALPAGKSEAIFFDDEVPGFGVRLRDGGSRNWIFQYKLGAKQRRLTLGAVSALDFGKARDTAKDLHAKVRLGGDPAGEKAHAKVSAAQTFKAEADRFLIYKKETLRPRSYVDVERHLLVHAKQLHELQLAKIGRLDIATCIGAVGKNSGAVTGNRVRTTLSTLFAWAIGEGLVDVNPVTNTNRHEERSRERVLSSGELRLVWNALEDEPYGAIMKLLALTGARAGEIAGLRWSELGGDAIALPGERTKNHRPHILPLSATARAIVEAQPKRADRDLIFGSGGGPFSGWSKAKEKLDSRIAAAAADGKALPHWTPHDLRRSFATHAAGIGVQPHVIEAILNHVSGHRAGVAGVYNRNAYEAEKRTALDRWAEHLTAIVEGRQSNVTPLRREA